MPRLAMLVGALLAAACAPLPSPPVAAPSPTTRDLTEPERAAFADLLGLEDRRAYEPTLLEPLAGSPSAAIRARTALALGRLGRSEGVSLASPLLGDADSAVAATAAFALGEIADSTAARALAAKLAGDAPAVAPTVAGEAAYALGKLPGPFAQEVLLEFLGRAHPGGAPSEVIGSALLAVWRFGRPADPGPVVRWLSSSDPELRWRAAYALSRRNDPRNVRALIGLAGDADARVRSAAVRALTPAVLDSAGIPHGEALAPLLRLVHDADYATRINAVRALGGFSTVEAIDTLRSLLRSPDEHLAVTAMESLGRVGPGASGSAGELEAIATSATAQLFVRQSAIAALALVSPDRARAVGSGLSGDPAWRIRAGSAGAIAKGGVASFPELRSLIADPDGRVAAGALQAAIDAVGDSLSLVRPLLIEQLGAGDPYVRATALGGLARLKDPATLPLLLDAFQRAQRDTVNDVALAALDALAALRTETLDPARTFLARFPRSSDYLVRQKAEAVLGAAVRTAWGDALPIESGRAAQGYRTLVDRWGARGERAAREPVVVISTSRGDIRVRLFGGDAPMTTDNFLALAARGYFDGQEWPRVVPNFVVQGGDPRGDTNGGPGYVIRDEINRHRYLTGTVGMALSGPDTGGSQFFLTHSPQPHLDGIYTIFGEVVDGLDVLQRILPGDPIRSVRAAN